jgi:hypothetical protein
VLIDPPTPPTLPARGTHWKHRKRGSVCVVLNSTEIEVEFQFPEAVKNPARGIGRCTPAQFLCSFEEVLS